MKPLKKDILKLANQVLRAEINLYKKAEKQQESFEEAIKGKTFKHPETKNDVSFSSLPAEEQKKIRAEFDKSSPEKELSKEDQKALDSLSDLDLDSDDLAELLEEVAKDLEGFDLTEEQLKELDDMDFDDLFGQAESMLQNTDDGAEALSKALEDYDDDDDDDDDALSKALTEKPKLDEKSQKHFDELDNLVKAETISNEELQSVVEGILTDAEDDDFDDILDVGVNDLDNDQLMQIVKLVCSKDKEMAGELNEELRDKVIKDVIENEDYPTDNAIGEEMSNLLGKKLEEAIEEEDFSDMSLDDLRGAKKKVEEAKQLYKDKFTEIKKSLEEKFGGDEDLVDHAMYKLGFESTWDMDNDKELEEILEDFGISLGEEFDSILKEKEDKAKEEKAKEDKAKEEKARADKAKADKSKADKSKADKSEKAKAKRESINKSKEDRDKAKSDAIGKLDGMLEDSTKSGGMAYEDIVDLTIGMHSSLFDTYGIDNDKDLEDLDDEALADFISSMREIDQESIKKLTAINEKKLKSMDKVLKRSDELDGEMTDLDSKITDFNNQLEDDIEELESLQGKSNLNAKQKKKLKELEKSVKEDGAKAKKMQEDLEKLIDEDADLEEEYQDALVGKEEGADTFLNGRFGDQVGGTNSSMDNPFRSLQKAVKLQGDRKQQKELEEAKKKADEEHKQKVKDYTKKIGDLTSNAQSADSSSAVNDLWGELGRIKGQLKSSEVLGEVQGDLDKAEKAIKDAQEKNSFSGKLKSFFGWGKGKKASQSQKDKVAKIALEILKEEIALYKEEESRRNKNR